MFNVLAIGGRDNETFPVLDWNVYPQSFPKWGYLPVANWRSSEYCSPSHCKEQPVLEQHKKGQSNRSYEEADVGTYCNGLLCGMWTWLVEYRVGGEKLSVMFSAVVTVNIQVLEEYFWTQEIKALAFLLCQTCGQNVGKEKGIEVRVPL